MKKMKYFSILFALLIFSSVNAETQKCEFGTKLNNISTNNLDKIIDVTSFKETVNPEDEYLTIEKNSTIIGGTKFTDGEIITALKVSKAGYDYALLKVSENEDGFNYDKFLDIFIYYGEVGGWYKLDEKNNVTEIVDEDTINKLSNQKIYAINNVRKGIYAATFSEDTIPKNSISCIDFGIYTIREDNNVKYYVSSSNTKDFDIYLYSALVKLKYNAEKVSYDVNIYRIEIEDVEDGLPDEKIIYVKDSNNNKVSSDLTITYLEDNPKNISVDSNGYTIPSTDGIDRIYFKK